MAPELFYPEQFGLTRHRPTKLSDCYALGMVVYEVLSAKVPFYHYNYFNGIAAMVRILKGDRPQQPQGEEGLWFTEAVWNTLECCWKPTPGDRPSAEDVLHSLEKASMSWTPDQTIACSATTAPATLNLDRETLESTGKSETKTQSTSQITPSQPPSLEDILQHLTGSGVPQGSPPSLIAKIASNLKVTDIVQRLQRSDARTFIDGIDQVCGTTSLLRKKLVANFSPLRRLIALTFPHESTRSV